jgi:Putative heavy-metal-binding
MTEAASSTFPVTTALGMPGLTIDQELGANAIVAMRFDSSEMGQQLTEIVAYGTAVIVSPVG